MSESIRSPSLGPVNVQTLGIDHDDAVLAIEDAQWALATWAKMEPLSHYRVAITSSDGRRARFVAFFEPDVRRGAFAQLGSSNRPVPLTNLANPTVLWGKALDALRHTAAAADVEERRKAG